MATVVDVEVAGEKKVDAEQKNDSVDNEDEGKCLTVKLATDLSFAVNILLFAAKVVATITSGSISVLASMIDSFLDLMSGSIIWLTERAMDKTDVALYPAGRTRLEPVGVIVFATMMGMATLQLLNESVQKLLGPSFTINADAVTIAILASTIGLKLSLFILCSIILKSSKSQSASVEALREDHRNDCFSNGVAIIAVVLAGDFKHLWWTDPAGAIIIALYILFVWCSTGIEQVRMLSGRIATPEFQEEVKAICSSHYDGMHMDKLRAYHFGLRYLVEVEVVLPEDMILKQTHDIGLDLQHKIEALEDVERAFVHIDYEDRPHEEHKIERELLEREEERRSPRNSPRKSRNGALSPKPNDSV